MAGITTSETWRRAGGDAQIVDVREDFEALKRVRV